MLGRGVGYWDGIQGGLEEDPVPWGGLPSQALACSCSKSPFCGDSVGLTSPKGHGELEPGVPALKSPFYEMSHFRTTTEFRRDGCQLPSELSRLLRDQG